MSTKFVVYTETFEVKTHEGALMAWTEQELIDHVFSQTSQDPQVIAEFDSKEEAMKELEVTPVTTGRTEGYIGKLLVGNIAFMQEEEYDEDGEFVQGDRWSAKAESIEAI